MELHIGRCAFCSNTNVVSHSQAQSTINIISSIFQRGTKDPVELKKVVQTIEACPRCIYKLIILDQTRKKIESIKSKDYILNKCSMCNEATVLVKLKEALPDVCDMMDNITCSKRTKTFTICTGCIFYLDEVRDMKSSLFTKYPLLLKLNPPSEGNSSISTPDTKKRISRSSSKKQAQADDTISVLSANDESFTSTASSLKDSTFYLNDSLKHLTPIKNISSYNNDEKIVRDKKMYEKVAYILLKNIGSPETNKGTKHIKDNKKDKDKHVKIKMKPSFKIKLKTRPKPKSKKLTISFTNRVKTTPHSIEENDLVTLGIQKSLKVNLVRENLKETDEKHISPKTKAAKKMMVESPSLNGSSHLGEHTPGSDRKNRLHLKSVTFAEHKNVEIQPIEYLRKRTTFETNDNGSNSKSIRPKRKLSLKHNADEGVDNVTDVHNGSDSPKKSILRTREQSKKFKSDSIQSDGKPSQSKKVKIGKPGPKSKTRSRNSVEVEGEKTTVTEAAEETNDEPMDVDNETKVMDGNKINEVGDDEEITLTQSLVSADKKSVEDETVESFGQDQINKADEEICKGPSAEELNKSNSFDEEKENDISDAHVSTKTDKAEDTVSCIEETGAEQETTTLLEVSLNSVGNEYETCTISSSASESDFLEEIAEMEVVSNEPHENEEECESPILGGSNSLSPVKNQTDPEVIGESSSHSDDPETVRQIDNVSDEQETDNNEENMLDINVTHKKKVKPGPKSKKRRHSSVDSADDCLVAKKQTSTFRDNNSASPNKLSVSASELNSLVDKYTGDQSKCIFSEDEENGNTSDEEKPNQEDAEENNDEEDLTSGMKATSESSNIELIESSEEEFNDCSSEVKAALETNKIEVISSDGDFTEGDVNNISKVLEGMFGDESSDANREDGGEVVGVSGGVETAEHLSDILDENDKDAESGTESYNNGSENDSVSPKDLVVSPKKLENISSSAELVQGKSDNGLSIDSDLLYGDLPLTDNETHTEKKVT